MSNVSDIHSFVAFESKGTNKSVALSGQRLLVVRFKTGKDGKKATSMCASVPMLGEGYLTDEEVEALKPHMYEWLRGVQDDIGRDLVVAGAKHITTEQLSGAAIVAHLNSIVAGGRLTSDAITEWFKNEVADVLTVAFADKLGVSDTPTEEQTKTIERMCNVYRDKFASMAGGRTAFDKVTIGKLQKALELVDTSDAASIGGRLNAKLEEMSKVSMEEMLGL